MTTTVAPTHVATGDITHQARAAAVVWRREMIRFSRDRARMFSSLVQPLLFLFVFGPGLGSLMHPASGGAVDFATFLFPGVLATSVLFTAAFSGISMVWDREFGFLREMLVAPISTGSIMLGKTLGGATVATTQGLVILALAGFVDVPYEPLLMAELIMLTFLMAFLITALGLLLAARVKQVQAAMPLVQLIITPLMFMSGALFPLSGLPRWLDAVIKLNPMTYAVQPLRRAVFNRLDVSAELRAIYDPGLHWGTWDVPVSVQVTIVATIAVALLSLAVAAFARRD